MRPGESFSGATVNVWTELPRRQGLTYEGVTICVESGGKYAVWWVAREHSTSAYPDRGAYVIGGLKPLQSGEIGAFPLPWPKSSSRARAREVVGL